MYKGGFKFAANLGFMFPNEMNLIEKYRLAKQCGFDAVECPFPYDEPLEKVKSIADELGLKHVLINTYPGDRSKGELGYAAVPGKEKEFMESLHKTIEYAKALKCTMVHIMSGLLSGSRELCYSTYTKNIAEAAQILQKENIIGLIEPISGYVMRDYYMNSVDLAGRCVRSVNSEYLRMQLDIFHLQQMDGGLTYNIELHAPYIKHIQIAQVPNRNEPDSFGEINYKYVFNVLKKIKYSGWIGLEYTPLKDAENSLKWLRDETFFD